MVCCGPDQPLTVSDEHAGARVPAPKRELCRSSHGTAARFPSPRPQVDLTADLIILMEVGVRFLKRRQARLASGKRLRSEAANGNQRICHHCMLIHRGACGLAAVALVVGCVPS